MASLFDVFGRLLLDDREFQSDAERSARRAGDTVGKTMGERVSGGLRTGLTAAARVGGTALAGGFAIAARGALELQNVAADIQASTGATAEEAKEASKAINRIAGDQRQALSDVAAANVEIRRNMGLTGEAADELTADFVKFARVTKQTAGGAVTAFDDILDNWGLTVDDARGLMDKLTVSVQRWGGTVEERQKSLAQLAPALKAANFEVDDAIGLLNLFGAKGLDANQGAAAFAKALTKVESPDELKELIADISATEDPFERARKAADLFGARAGAKLANALAGANLDEFAIDAEDAAGAVEKAADALDNTDSARFQRMISQAQAKLREFGSEVGPVLTGAASAVSLAGAFGLDRAAVRASGAFLRGLRGIGGRIAATLASAIGSRAVEGAVTRAGGNVGELTTDAITRRLAGRPMAQKLGDGLIGSMGASESRTTKAAGKLGGKLGTALKAGLIAAAAFAWLEVVNTYNDQKAEIDSQLKDIGETMSRQLAVGSVEELKRHRAVVAKGLVDLMNIRDFGLLTGDARRQLEAELERIDAAIERHAAAGAEGATEAVTTELGSAGDRWERATERSADGVTDALDDLEEDAEEEGEDLAGAYSEGIVRGFDDVESGLEGLVELMRTALSPAKKIARLEAILTGKAITAGLEDSRPEVKTAAQQLAIDTIAQLADLKPDSKEIGKQVSQLLASGMTIEKVRAHLAAAGLSKDVIDQLTPLPPKARTEGEETSSELAAGMDENEPRVEDAADRLERAAESASPDLHRAGERAAGSLASGLNSPAGRRAILTAVQRLAGLVGQFLGFVAGTGPRPSTSTTAGNTRNRASGGFVDGPTWVGEFGRELFVPRTPGRVLSSTVSESSAVSPTYQVNVTATREARNPFEIMDQLRRFGDMGVLPGTRGR